MGVKVREKIKGSGEWWIFIDHNGKRKAKKIGNDETLARQAAKKIEAKLTLGDFGIVEEKPNIPMYKDYAELWLEAHIKPFKKHTTYERYHGILNQHIFPKFKQHRLDEIGKREVKDFFMGLLKSGLKFRTVELIKDVLSGPLTLAVDEELIMVNPCNGALKRLGTKGGQAEAYDVYDQKEVAIFLGAAEKYEPAYYPLFLTLFRTGTRLGEAVAMRWSLIDWNSGFIMVKQTYRRGKLDSTKTGRARRVDMTDQLTEALKDFRLKKQKESLANGMPMSEFVFCDKTGQPLSQNSARNVFKRNAKKAGLRAIRVHDTRHSYASILISEGVPIAYVKEQLGHSSIQMTVDRYGHWIPSGNHHVNILDTQPSATYPQPAQKEKA